MTIRVVVADDSPFLCHLLTQYLESDPAIRVIRTANNGKEASDFVKRWKPDVLTLDLNMPVMNGLDALRDIMAECPTPVVLISGAARESARMTKMGLALGAVDFVLKYSPNAAVPPDSLRHEIIAKVRVAARVKVIRTIPSMNKRFGKGKYSKLKIEKLRKRRYFQLSTRKDEPPARIVIIGASTGGPLALKDLLSSLGKMEKFKTDPFPVVIVQHMPEGFTAILAAQFDRLFPFPVREAEQGDFLSPGTVLIAPGDRHLLICPDYTILLNMAPPVNGQRPSVDVTMQSAAQVFRLYTTGVILSGMGDDGTQGLVAIKNNCGITFAQTEETCVVDTMPSSATEKGVVERTGSPADIGRWVCH